MNEKLSVFVTDVEAIIYLLLYNLHDCTFNVQDHAEASSRRLIWYVNKTFLRRLTGT